MSDPTLHRGVWIRKYRDAAERGLKYGDERDFTQTRDAYEAGLEQMRELRQPDALCAQVSAMFVRTSVREKVSHLDKLLNEYTAATDHEEIEQLRDLIDKAYADAVQAMGAELREEYAVGYASARGG